MPEADQLVEEPAKKKKKPLIFIIVAVVLLLLGGGGYFAYTTFMKPAQPPAENPANPEQKADQPAKEEKKPEKKEEKKGEKKEGGKEEKKPVTSIAGIVTNLADPGGRRYIKISLDFDFADEDTAKDFEAQYQAKIKDAVLTLLWSKTSDEMNSVEGVLAFRNDVVTRVNQILGQGKVKNVYITDKVVQ
jgi:flagellar FliL protein